MNATPPEAKAEYSRAQAGSKGPDKPRSRPPSRLLQTIPAAVLACGAVGSVLLIGSEFTNLYQVHVTTQRAAVDSVTGGSHNSYAFIPIAVLAVVLAYGAAREGARVALLALGLVGVVSLLIALVGDLPNAQSSGLLTEGGHLVSASSSPSAGMYLETLGAVVLIIGSGVGLLLGSPTTSRRARSRARRWRPPRAR
jgi:hypothetical protein